MTVMEDVQSPVTSNSHKRSMSWWDSLYTGKPLKLSSHGWDFTNNKGPFQLLFTAATLKNYTDSLELRRFSCRSISFDNCDFDGEFTSDVSNGDITFAKCNFSRCDFGGTVWRGVKFNECKFERCSFTLAEFEDCNFIECAWADITLSGTETKLPNTLISNPDKFISAAYTNLNKEILSRNNTNPSYQKMRLESTKATFSRTLLKNAESHGNEDAYYNALKTHLNQSLKSRAKKTAYELFLGKDIISNFWSFLAALLEILLINITGSLNSWGKSIARPAIIGLSLTLFFGLLYGYIDKNYATGIIKGFDITFLVGYTKHSNNDISQNMQVLYGVNAFFGLWWYAILVPTIINRISRVN
ncbi:anti-phage Hailong system effector protein HalA [Pseudomonas sp. MF7453]|uniref:anti-phage Hailong system effector protein HalA n=1 Tax=Pseudomonas sp. MF7453 TaxID=2797539 RepID=UPI0018E90003|nr:pentapeptide repeat-containing protein [Pseudomonas sp. MF7453]MBJ2219588.1 pentapeptide repeat-containing protein [Pseudomonas sp. MF7453]